MASLATAPAFAEASHTAEYLHWQPAGKLFAAELRIDVVDTLNRQVMEAFKALPVRGAEVGGLLLGYVERAANTVVYIQGHVPVPCSYAHGPSYRLTPDEESRFAEIIAQPRAAVGQLSIVGLYRSHTRKDLSLNAEDLALWESCLPTETSMFLLVRPFASRANVGGIFFRERGQVRESKSYLEFPFQRPETAAALTEPLADPLPRDPLPADWRRGTHLLADPVPDSGLRGTRLRGTHLAADPLPETGAWGTRLRGEHLPADRLPVDPLHTDGLRTDGLPLDRLPTDHTNRPRGERPARADNLTQAVVPPGNSLEYRVSGPESVPSNSFVQAPESNRAPWPRLALPGFVVVAILSLFAFAASGILSLPLERSRKTPARAYSLGLEATENGNQVKVRWDRKSPLIGRARRGVLSITDGTFVRDLELDGAELQNGSLSYACLTKRVNFRLEVFADNQTSASQILTFKAAGPPQAPTDPAQAIANSGAAPVKTTFPYLSIPAEGRQPIVAAPRRAQISAAKRPRRVLSSDVRAVPVKAGREVAQTPATEIEISRPAPRR